MKLAILGAGKIVKDFLSMVGQLPEINLQAIFGREADLENMQAFQTSFRIQKIYTDVDALLADPDVDTIYIGLPNNLHFVYAKKALTAGKHVILEKPFVQTTAEFHELKQLAVKRHLHLYEAISNQYLANFQTLQDWLPKLGPIHLAVLNYSQYSSRYDQFKAGTILPAFDVNRGGGALQDLNVYNIHLAVGLFGQPRAIHYAPNIVNGVDTSGVLSLSYPDLTVAAIAGKDVYSLLQGDSSVMEGEKGFIRVQSPTNQLAALSLHTDDEDLTTVPVDQHRMYDEFKTFNQAIADDDWDLMLKMLDHSYQVIRILEQARTQIGPNLHVSAI
ncbi:MULTISPECIES: Gfo/Idh/MocA family protein [Oenococcus]|uniref:NAD-dependent oxidoreductase n=1 Tax=Oenococcus kitaharae DSM 17330 TaxID=1045004 RepID=G9WJD4_9LACO|nr:Gfo/Idh/MocA family oxidoreductase [Oenococcus kitaharae]EHN58740.1 NAD-dependent oxidoreductase [Oenococcus kitaharae DSM 17330]OEY81908.1 NAD-dependent oxidoreductase [Oenococcus kitaharae]OEY82298.1 NAD-dependent oxidoreductase [Oenococcus kitaharae]OEY82524.1 NAD-dependent oxidoreductase [Oenococcus kitaharae]